MNKIKGILDFVFTRPGQTLLASGVNGTLWAVDKNDDGQPMAQGELRCRFVPLSASFPKYALSTWIAMTDKSGGESYCRRVQMTDGRDVLFEQDFPVDSKAGMREYHAIRQKMHLLVGAPQKSGSGKSVLVACIWVVGLVLVASILTNPPSRPSRQASAPPAMDPQIAALMAAQSGADAPGVPTAPPSPEEVKERPRLSQAQMAKLANSARIELEKTGNAYYVFSDPGCPSCRKLEQNLSQQVPGFKQVVIPVAYRTGSMDLAAAVMCAPKDQQVKAWKDAVEFNRSPGPVCDEGVKKVKANMAIFEASGFDATPTMVSPRGAFITGAGSFDQVSFWLKNY